MVTHFGYARHATDFSIAGALNHTYNAITGTNSLAFQNNFFAQAVLANPITIQRERRLLHVDWPVWRVGS